LKIQEEQRERRLEKAPEHSKVDINNVPVDEETMKMLEKIGMNTLTGLQVQEVQAAPR
jgi:flagellar basal body rod protein FlgB